MLGTVLVAAGSLAFDVCVEYKVVCKATYKIIKKAIYKATYKATYKEGAQ